MARDTILIIDKDTNSVDIMNTIFRSEYKIYSCVSGKEALDYLTRNYKNIAIILLDLQIQGMDGMVLLKVLNTKKITRVIPTVIMSETREPEKIEACYENGATDYIMKPFVPVAVKGRVKNLALLFRSKGELQAIVNEQTSKIKEQNTVLKGFNDRIIEVMSSIVEFRNLESENHIKRIKAMTRLMAEMVRRMYPEQYNISEEDVAIMESASALHDIGKISISDTILLKPGRLLPDEFEVIKSHTTLGCEILKQLEEIQDRKYMEMSYNICRYHHERYDGRGYPDCLSGEDIPIEAQIVSIVDAYEALVGERVYRDAFDKNKAFNMIIKGECGAFSEHIINAFVKAKPMLEKECEKYSGE